MKKFYLFSAFIILALNAQAWKPIFAGHRGSYTGVENTEEAYLNGITKYGYAGLECDVRVTKDKQYVISHDETTTRLGGSLTIADATLAELEAETYSQTRGSAYTGKICTISKYLDICKANNVFPLIELKWSTGINSNDMSNFPGLYDLIKSKAMEDKVIFLTSMKASLEYIRTNYPTAKGQFLCSTNWNSNFEWCKKWMINPSIQAGCFDIQTVKKFHDIGLQVAVWTVDSEANYELYGNMGVYMITTNYLYPANLKELQDIDWDAIKEVPDPISINVKTLYKYSASANNLPENFPVGTSTTFKTAQQATYVDGIFYTNDYGTSTLLTYDKTGKIDTGLSGTNAHGITCDDAGNLILRNDGITANPSELILYKKGSTSPISISFALLNPGQTNFISASGDVFSTEGGYVYFFPNGQKLMNYLKIADGKLVEVKSSGSLSISGSTAGIIIPIGNDPDNFIYQVRNQGFYYYNVTDKGAYLVGSSSTTAPARNSSVGGAVFTINGHEIFVHPSGSNYNGGFSIKDMSAANAELYTASPLGTVGYSGNPSCGEFFKAEQVDENTVNLYEYCIGNGYAAYQISNASSSGVYDIGTNSSSSITLYPNPAISSINIASQEEISTLQIYDVTGKLVINLNDNLGNKNSLDITTLSPGIYFIQTNHNNTARFIKK